MVSIQFDRNSPQKPRYRAIADALAEQIAKGELEPGERLSSLELPKSKALSLLALSLSHFCLKGRNVLKRPKEVLKHSKSMSIP